MNISTPSSCARPRFTLIGLLCLGGFMSACAVEPMPAPTRTPSAPTNGTAPESAAQLYPAITALIGDAACDSPSQCHSVGVGAKACGGPNGYLAWSSKATDPAALRSAVERHAQAQKLEDQRAGMASNCMVTADPGAVCQPRAGDSKRICQPGRVGFGRPD